MLTTGPILIILPAARKANSTTNHVSTFIEVDPLVVLPYFDLSNRMNFPHGLSVLSHVVPMLRIEHEPTADAYRKIFIQPCVEISCGPFWVFDSYPVSGEREFEQIETF
jgi:hypothetical protein